MTSALTTSVKRSMENKLQVLLTLLSLPACTGGKNGHGTYIFRYASMDRDLFLIFLLNTQLKRNVDATLV